MRIIWYTITSPYFQLKMKKYQKFLRPIQEKRKTNKNINFVRSGIWTHALVRGPELESGALDHSAILTLTLSLQKIYIYNVLLLFFPLHHTLSLTFIVCETIGLTCKYAMVAIFIKFIDLLRHDKTGKNFLTRPKKYPTWTRFFWPVIRPVFFASQPDPTEPLFKTFFFGKKKFKIILV